MGVASSAGIWQEDHFCKGFGDKVAELANFTTSAVYLREAEVALFLGLSFFSDLFRCRNARKPRGKPNELYSKFL